MTWVNVIRFRAVTTYTAILEVLRSGVAQLAEQLTVNQWVAGSSPAPGAKMLAIPWGPVAQWLERATHNRLVAGSIPAWPTIPQATRLRQA